jgi:hypothetical protein
VGFTIYSILDLWGKIGNFSSYFFLVILLLLKSKTSNRIKKVELLIVIIFSYNYPTVQNMLFTYYTRQANYCLEPLYQKFTTNAKTKQKLKAFKIGYLKLKRI